MEVHQNLLTKDEESGTSLRTTHPFSIWRSLCSSWRSWKSTIYILAGPLVCIIAIMVGKVAMKNPREDSRAIEMMGALCWIFMWWLTSAVPVAVTSMAPLYLFPLLEIAKADDVAKYYMNDVISLVLGSFIMAIAVEEYKMHKRLALNILIFFTNSSSFKPRMLLLGFCGATAFVSMWMHNVAAAVLMMPVATGLLHGLGTPGTSLENSIVEEDEEFKAEQRDMELFSKAVVLGVTYSAAIGGMSTLTGTGVNLILVGIWQSYFPEQPPITFMNWFFFGFPLALLMFLSLWFILCVLFFTKSSAKSISASVNKYHLQSELQQLGPMSFAEKTVLTTFSLLIVLWMTKSLSDGVPGWGDLFLDYPGDGTVSVLMATLLFVIPSKQRPGEKIMDWEKCKKLPWHIILLLGAGFAIAGGVRESGLAEVMAKKLEFLESCPSLAIAPAVALISSSITELTSNNATTTLLLPILIQVALSMGVHPLLLMIPGAVGAQYSFLLPTSTPSNSVGFATGHVDIKDMVVTGIPLKLFGIIVITLLGPTLGAYVFDTATWTPIP